MSDEKSPIRQVGAKLKLPDYLVVAIITALGAGLRLLYLGRQSFWNDEVITIHVASAPFDEILVYFLHDSSPPLYYLFLKVWLQFARTEAAIRLLPALFGILAVLLTYLVFRKIAGRRPALIAALVLAVHPYHIYYSQENRYVTLLTLIGLISVWAYLRFLRRNGLTDAVLLGFCLAAMAYTHYYAFFLIAGLALHCLVFHLRSLDRLLKGLLASAVGFFLFLPWLAVLQMQLSRGQPAREVFGPLSQLFITGMMFLIGGSEWGLPQIPFTFISPNQAGYMAIGLVLLIPLALLVVRGIVADFSAQTSRGILTAAVIVPLVLVMIVSGWLPIYRPKYLVMLLPFFLGLAAWGLVELAGSKRRIKQLPAALLAGFLALILIGATVRVYFNPYYQRENWKQAAKWLDDHQREGDVLLLYNPYSASAWRHYYRPGIPVVSIVSPFTRPVLPAPEVLERRLADLGKKHRRIWVLDYQDAVHDPDHVVLNFCRNKYFPLKYLDYDRDRHFTLMAFAADEQEHRRSYTDRVDFSGDWFLPEQLGPGWLGQGGPSTRWMSQSAVAYLRHEPNQELVQVAFFVHLPYFEDRPLTASLEIEGQPALSKTIRWSDNVVMSAVVPDHLINREILEIKLSFDRAFVPHDLFGDQDLQPKTVLVYGFSMLYLGYQIR